MKIVVRKISRGVDGRVVRRRGGATVRSWRRGSALLMTLVYMLMFAALASSMVAFSQGNMAVQQGELDASRALNAAESGMSFLLLEFRLAGQPVIKEGSIANMATPSQIWSGKNIEGFSGNNGIAVNLAAAINGSGAVGAGSTAAPSGTSPLVVPAITVDPGSDNSTYTLSVSWDAANPTVIAGTNTSVAVLHCKSVGTAGKTSRSVTMDIWVQKSLKYAVYSNVAIQLGKNVRVIGDVASTYTGTNKGPPVQMVSDFHYLPNMGAIDNNLATLRGLLDTYDTSYTNRLNLGNSAAAAAAAAAGLKDMNNDGYIDDMDIALKQMDANKDAAISQGEFTNPNTGKLYDPDLFTLIDSPEGAVDPVTGNLANGSSPLWNGYGDGTANALDGYAKVNGSVKTALTYPQWQAAASGWGQWGDTSGGASGTKFRDQFEGPVVAADPTTAPVQFGVDFGSDQTLTPSDFDTSAYDAKIPSTTASKLVSGGTTTISNGTLTASQANGTTVVEHSPASATSGWQATYSRPVFQNVTFNNVRIPKGLNAKFVNCTFKGYTSVKMTTNITKAGTNTTTTDASDGMGWAQQMNTGTFTADTKLTSTNSVAYQQGNNLHFSGCTFSGVMTADVPTAYTHFADSWEFDGTTNFNNTVDPSVTIMAPNTNIEIGSYVSPGTNPSTLVGVVVAGNIDIRGTTTVDGSLLVTGTGAGNTTLGYFGTTDQGQAVPTLSQLPASANGSYGHLFFKINSDRGMPNGIAIPVVSKPQLSTYQIQ